MVAQAEPSSSRTIRSELVVVAGLAVKSVFVGIAYWALNVLSGPYSNSLAYAWAFLGIGAFLTGLSVGFLMKNMSSAAMTGFLCAVIPTLVFSAVAGQGSRNPIGWLLFVILFAPLDVLAVAGGLLGAWVKARMFGVAVLAVLILLSLVAVSVYSAASMVHYVISAQRQTALALAF